MKRLLISTITSLLFLGVGAQTNERKWNLGLLGGTSEYEGDLGNRLLYFNNKTIDNIDKTYTVGLSLTRYLNRTFDFGAMGTYGSWGYYEPNQPGFRADMLQINGHLKFKFNNGFMLEENSLFQPYLIAGAGVNRFQGTNTKEGQDFSLVTGGGFNFRLSGVIGLNYQATYGYLVTSDLRDLQPVSGLNDAFLLHTIGLNFNLGTAFDSDGDGVHDKKDKCANTPKNAKVDKTGCPIDTDKDGVADYLDNCPNESGTANGCPDNDKDGVANKDDQCPDVAGLTTLSGCPDADNDGIIDSKDNCPNVKGSLALNGCPDRDNDGVADELDACPDVYGLASFKGCPDNDNDGIENSKDMCPDLKGPLSTNGCPDTDNDGVHDGIDKCPRIAGNSNHSGCPDSDNDGVYDDIDKCITTPGTMANQGCPEVKKEVKQLFEKALQGIQFETGKAVIKSSSNPILNSIVKVMKENPTYKLLIGGHTDNVGDDEMNYTLSQDRATAVSKYLISNGVDPLRATAKGYGESMPIDVNTSVKGRTRNRRVELKVEFIEIVK
jgi:outer membrane protein OmpA-like peptidoglycan-associated protein